MMAADIGPFTPIPHTLAHEVGLVCAAVYGVVWRKCQMEEGVCRASLDTLGTDINVDRATVLRNIKKLCELGYLTDLTPDRRNAPHDYILAETVAQRNSLMDTGVVMRSDSGAETVAEKNKTVAHNNSSMESVAERNATVAQSNATVAESYLKKDVVAHDKQSSTFEILYNRWLDNNLGKLGPRQVELFGDYYDEHPDWVSEIIDTTIGGKPGNPWQYFVKIINSWVKNGKPPLPPPKQESPARYGAGRNGRESIPPTRPLDQDKQATYDELIAAARQEE